jgi:L-amino acid N-acyltransferase YncA
VAAKPIAEADGQDTCRLSRYGRWKTRNRQQALGLLLKLVPARPLHARAASDNIASLRVLQKEGFNVIGTENSYAPARKGDIEETILQLE